MADDNNVQAKGLDDLTQNAIKKLLAFYAIIALIYFMKWPKWIAYVLLSLSIVYLFYILFIVWVIRAAVTGLGIKELEEAANRVYMGVIATIVVNIALIVAFTMRKEEGESSSSKSSKNSK